MKKLILLITVLVFSSALFADTLAGTFINKCTCDKVIDNKEFKICYSYEMKGAKYVAYTLNGNLVNKSNIKRRPQFKSDNRIPRKYRAYKSDYRGSGYDRGHLAPDASFDYSIKALSKTYTMSNIIPQVSKINRYTWVKAEKRARELALKFGSVNVINGVRYSKNPKRIGRHHIAVPRAIWKMIYFGNFRECYYYNNSFMIPTRKDELYQHRVDCFNLIGE